MPKNAFAVLLILFFVGNPAYSQWRWLNPKPSGYSVAKMIFTDSQKGLILQSNGDISTTNDQGAHWNFKQNLPGAVIMDLKDSTAIACGFNIYYISTDNGITWQQRNAPSTDYMVMADVVSRDTLFMASTNGKIYRSDDRGNTWKMFSCGIQISSIEFINSKVGYAGGSSTYILKTVDGGATWQQNVVVNVIPSNTLAIKFIDINTGFAFREHSTILRTKDGGATWTSYNIGDKIFSFQFISNTTGFAVGEHGVAYRTDDGGDTWSWIGASARIYFYDLYSVYFFDANTGITAGARGRILKTTNGGYNWSAYSPTYLGISDISIPSGKVAFAIDGVSMYKSTDSGETWQNLETAPLVGTNYDNFELTHFFNADTGFVTASKPDRIYKTYDGGLNWRRINPTPAGYDNVTDVQFLNKDTGYLAINIYYGGTIVKTTDQGETWSPVWASQYFGEVFQKIFFVDEKTGYASRRNQLYKTEDSAKTWTKLWEAEDILSIHFVNPGTGFVAGNNAMLKMTSDSGKTWKNIQINSQYYDDIYNIRFFNERVGYFVAEFGDIYKTIDSGYTWKRDFDGPFLTMKGVKFAPDSSAYGIGENGQIIKTDFIGEMQVDSFKVTRPGNCTTTLSSKVSAVLIRVDSIWYQYGILDLDQEIAATPSAFYNKTQTVTASISDLPPNTTYYARLKLFYRGEYHYQPLNFFSTPSRPATPIITTASGTDICEGDSAILTASTATLNQWYFNHVAINGATSQTLKVGSAGLYQLVRRSDCYLSDTAAVTIRVNPVPSKPVITLAGNILSSSATFGNQWFLNGQPIAGATAATLTPTASGVYTVKYTLNNCTSPLSDPFNFTVTSINVPDFVKKLALGPNPARDQFVIIYTGNPVVLRCTIIDMNGRTINLANFNTSLTIDTRKFSTGLYLVEIINQQTGEKMTSVLLKQ